MPAMDIDTLMAQRAITDVLIRYCRAMDRIDAKLGYSIWHDDGIADYGPVFKGTGREFIDWVCGFHRTLVSHSHQIANVLIDVQGERAASETYVAVGLLSAKDGGHSLVTGRGRYLDRWSKRNARWAIDHRQFVLDFAITQHVEAQLPWGARDSTDPSYKLLGA
jgi:hypothetical protein